MSDPGNFAHAIATELGLTEVELVVRAAWYLRTISGERNVPVEDAIEFLKEWSIRPNINVTRLKTKLRKTRNVSFQASGNLHIPASNMTEFDREYLQFLEIPPPQIEDTILQNADFVEARQYIQEIVRQINGSFQFKLFDGCAVMMRRLAEVLIIDAYISKNEDNQIRDGDGNLKMMNGLIKSLTSGRTFKLSRNAPKYLDDVKTLGDNAAHSRNYITKSKDIEDFAQRYRMLIEELKNLV